MVSNNNATTRTNKKTKSSNVSGSKQNKQTTKKKKKKKKVKSNKVLPSSSSNGQNKVVKKPKAKSSKNILAKAVLMDAPDPDPFNVLKSRYGGCLSPIEEFSKCISQAPMPDVLVSKFEISIDRSIVENIFVSPDKKKLQSRILFCSKLSSSCLREYTRHGESDVPEKIDGVNLCIKSSDLEGFCLPSLNESSLELHRRLVSLDLTDNIIGSNNLVLGKSSNIRLLRLRANQLTVLPSLSGTSKLLYLDLSYNSFGTLDPLKSLKDTCPQLRGLELEKTEISSLCTDGVLSPSLSGLQFLSVLNLASNKLADPLELYFLEKLSNLVSLSIQRNPFFEKDNAKALDCVAKLKMKLPRLKNLDGENHSIEVRANNSNLVGESVKRSVVDGLAQDNSSCSCVEGNPCAVRYNCKDWENRFKVARNARLKKGLVFQ